MDLPNDCPASGDVLVTREASRYTVSIIPQRPLMTFGHRIDAVKFARTLAACNNVRAWHIVDQEAVQLPRRVTPSRVKFHG